MNIVACGKSRLQALLEELDQLSALAELGADWAVPAYWQEGLVNLWCCKRKHLLSRFKDIPKANGIHLQVFKQGPDFVVCRRNRYRTGQCTLGFKVGNGVGPWTSLPVSKPLTSSLTQQLNNSHFPQRKMTPGMLQSVLTRCLEANQHSARFHNA